MLTRISDAAYRSYMRAYMRCDEPIWITNLRWRAFRVAHCTAHGDWRGLFSLQTLLAHTDD